MARSAKRPERRPEPASPLASGAGALFGVISRNPVLVGGSTAFLVALSFVSANALWYQPYAHKTAFFATRDFAGPSEFVDEPETTIRIVRPEAAATPVPPKSDPEVEQVQSILADLKLYDGKVDGLTGPATRKAIEAYQTKMGLTATGEVDDQLLDHLGAAPMTAGITPSPAPRPAAGTDGGTATVMTAGLKPDERIMRIQAGLKAFGNEGIEIDGVIGSRTKSAIHEFQALFGLPETGEPDDAVYTKMREIGLTN